MKKNRSGILTVVSKELRRFLTDRRMLVSILLPGILIYVLYSFMGDALSSVFSEEENATYTVAADHLPAELRAILEDQTNEDGKTPIFSILSDDISKEEGMALVRDGRLHLYMVFPEQFMQDILLYQPGQGDAPRVELFYRSVSTSSTTAYTLVEASLRALEDSLSNRFDVNADPDTGYDLSDEKDQAGLVFSSMMPMLLIVFLFTGCMSAAPESIAGEKERGTIATLLITPLRRSHLAIGKVIGIAVISVISALSSFVGTMLSLPRLMGDEAAISGAVYGVSDYLGILAVMLSAVLLFVAAISVISAFSRSVKEATAAVMPLMVISMLIGVTGMFGSGAPDSIFMYLIPIYGSVQALSAIFSFSATLPMILATVASSLASAALLILLLTRMFDSERIMFSRGV